MFVVCFLYYDMYPIFLRPSWLLMSGSFLAVFSYRNLTHDHPIQVGLEQVSNRYC